MGVFVCVCYCECVCVCVSSLPPVTTPTVCRSTEGDVQGQGRNCVVPSAFSAHSHSRHNSLPVLHDEYFQERVVVIYCIKMRAKSTFTSVQSTSRYRRLLVDCIVLSKCVY